MTPRPPSDAAVALRSLPRRFRGLFAGLRDDESPDALALRPDADGATAMGHLHAAVRLLVEGGRSVDRILVSDDPQLAPLPTAGTPPSDPAASGASGGLDEVLDDLAGAATAFADRVETVSAEDWARQGRVGTSAVSAADRLWQVVDEVVATLRAVEATLAETRRAR